METNESGFWRFAHERQRVWRRRQDGWPRDTWTDDPVLRAYRFTNVHRELDRGTVAIADRLHYLAAYGFSRADRAVNACALRLHNNPSAWRAFGRHDLVYGHDAAALARRVVSGLNRAADGGEKTGPQGWTACYWRRGGALLDFADAVARGEFSAVLDAVARSEAADGSLEPVFRELVRLPGMGQVVGFQCALDLRYVFPRLSDDVWVNVMRTRERVGLSGSGGGALLVRPGADPYSTMLWLRDSQDGHLAAAGLDWAAVAWEGKPRLTLADVEHTLCEYRKYVNAGRGVGKQRRL